MAMTICRDNMRRQQYWSNQSLDTPCSEDEKISCYDKVVAKENEREARECLNAVMSIKNREVREILILTGFIVSVLINDSEPSIICLALFEIIVTKE